MKSKLFQIECITNLHVGNGDVNYNIIDNEVERDPVTGYETINASGIKGAFREYFSKADEKQVQRLFGGNEGKITSPGAIKFMQADILARAVRATGGKEAYYLVAAENNIRQLEQKQAMIENKNEKYAVKKIDSGEQMEAEGVKLENYIEIGGKRIYVIDNEDYRKLALPVVARNKLDNGLSVNLWYEEVVPHHSIFTFYVLADDLENLSNFSDVISDKVVQFGGGATVGYGFCKVSAFKGAGML